jgi:hypothetical protein
MKRCALVLVLVAISACDSKTGMEVRSYELSRLTNDEAVALLTPYVSEGGYLSGKNKLISVRERPDRLTLIEGLLKKYDGVGEAVDVVMEIQVIEANGFTTTDAAIADIEQSLRETFKYRGYKLLGETRIQAREGGVFRQASSQFTISGRVQRMVVQGNERRIPIEVDLRVGNVAGLESTVTATVGKPVVLGQSTESGAIILVLRPTIAPI